jgi:hypothetical protein
MTRPDRALGKINIFPAWDAYFVIVSSAKFIQQNPTKRAFQIFGILSLRGTRSLKNTIQALLLGLAASCYLSAQSFACSPSGERTYIFGYAPTDIDASVIVEVTIEGREPDIVDPKTRVALKAVMRGEVEHVIKGRVSAKTLRILVELSDCIRGLAAGNKGFVAGELQSDSNGDVQLVANTENYRKAHARPN